VSLSGEEEAAIKQQAEAQAKSMNLSVVRLCFRAYLMDENGVCTRVLPPVISNPVFDSSKSFLSPYLYYFTIEPNSLNIHGFVLYSSVLLSCAMKTKPAV